MLDTCTVQTVTGETTDDLTGATVPIYELAYTGRCKVQTAEALERNPETGGATLTVQRLTVHVPVGSFAPAVGQVVTVTATALDPYLVGRQFRVVALLHKTAATAYRLGVEEVS
jgi:hypothetical protein